MTSKEMEERSGVPRANIRYYEAEGLLTPARSKNGYRDYSEKDLADLNKIKLLRRLGVSLESLKALRNGARTLSEVLEERTVDLAAERETLERVAQVCGDLQSAGERFETLDAAVYLRALDENRPLPALPESDTLPTVTSIPRRLFARLFDWYLTLSALLCLMSLLGQSPAGMNDFAVGLGVALLTLLLEPLLLRLFATTPGKALLGLRIHEMDGRKLPYGEGLTRTLLLYWYGFGAGIPIWSLVQLYRSMKRCLDQEPQPWDADTAYTARPFRPLSAAAYVLAAALLVAGTEAINSASQFPPNRGDLTVAEFAENFNRQAAYLGAELSESLDENGQWQAPAYTDTFVVSPTADWPEARAFRYTVEDGRLTAVTLEAAVENTGDWLELPTNEMALAVAAFTWAQPDAPFFPGERRALLEKVTAVGEEGYVLHQAGTVITLEWEQQGFYHSTLGMFVPEDDWKNALHFAFTIALEH